MPSLRRARRWHSSQSCTIDGSCGQGFISLLTDAPPTLPRTASRASLRRSCVCLCARSNRAAEHSAGLTDRQKRPTHAHRPPHDPRTRSSDKGPSTCDRTHNIDLTERRYGGPLERARLKSVSACPLARGSNPGRATSIQQAHGTLRAWHNKYGSCTLRDDWRARARLELQRRLASSDTRSQFRPLDGRPKRAARCT